MTTEATYFQPRTRDGVLSSFGLVGSIALTVAVLICLPVCVILALAIGVASLAFDLSRSRQHRSANTVHAPRARSTRPLDLDGLVSALHERFVETSIKPTLWLSRLEGRVAISLPGARSFLTDQPKLSPQGQRIATAIGDVLQGAAAHRVEVIGYGGALAPTSAAKEPLSRCRAAAVADALSAAGCDGSIVVSGAGEAIDEGAEFVVASGVHVIVYSDEPVRRCAA